MAEFQDQDQILEPELELLPPASLDLPLWRSLITNLADRFAPEKLPPLHLTSRPVDVGLLLGDKLALPWYRTVFTNLGDVISPETLPPLELESRPVDVGELIADQLAHNWWTSLLGNLRDSVAVREEPPLRVTFTPMNVGNLSGPLLLANWSSVISTPKVFLPDAPAAQSTTATYSLAARTTPAPVLPPIPPVDPELMALERKLRRDLRHSRIRQGLWISVVAAEVVFFVVRFGLQ